MSLIESLVLWLGVTAAASVVSSAAYPAFRSMIRRCRPTCRALSTLVFSVLPAAVAILVVCMAMHPALSAGLVPEHCHSDTCGLHAPEFVAASPGGTALILAIFLTITAAVITLFHALQAGTRRLRALSALSVKRTTDSYRLLESSGLVAWCCGLFKPQVYISQGLLQHLTVAQLRVVLAHEETHRSRRDNLRACLLHSATAIWPSWSKRRIREDFAIDTELVCDAAAQRTVGDRAQVISAIEAMQFPGEDSNLHWGLAFGCADPAARIDELNRRASDYRGSSRAWLLLSGLVLAQIVVLTGIAHLTVEWITSIGA